MPDSPPSPSQVMFARKSRVRPVSFLPARPSSRLGKRSSPPLEDGSTPPESDVENHGSIAPLRSSSAMGTSRIPRAEKQSTSPQAGRLTAGAAIEAAHKRYRSSSQIVFSRPSQDVARNSLTQRAVSGIPPPSCYSERPLRRASSRGSSSTFSSSGATRMQGEAYTALARPQQSHLRRPSLQPLIHQRQATMRSVSSNTLPPSKPEFTFKSRLSVQPHPGSATIDALPEPRLDPTAELPPRTGSCIRSSSDKFDVDQTPSKREAYATGKTERLLPAAAAVSAKRKVLDTPAARERGYRRLGNLMLLPGRRSMSNSGAADVIDPRDADPRNPSQRAEQGDSRSSTPTQKDFDDMCSQRLSSRPYNTDDYGYTALAKQASDLACRDRRMPDQTCVTLAALSVNEDTFLVSDDAILADLCAESSRVDYVADGRQPTTASPRSGCCPVDPSGGTTHEDHVAADRASEALYVTKRESDAHIAMLELQEKVDKLTRALQQETLSHTEDIARLQAANLGAIEEARKSREQVEKTETERRREEGEAELAKQAQVRSLQRMTGRALVGGAVAGYESLSRAVAVELDVVRSEREMCLLLLRNLQLWSSRVA